MTDIENTSPGATEDVWIVVGNANGWGKGPTLREALGNMFKETGFSHKPTEAIVYRWQNVPSSRVKGFYVDGFGTTRSPYLVENAAKRLHLKDKPALAKLHAAYFGFMDAVEEFEYAGPMAETFD